MNILLTALLLILCSCSENKPGSFGNPTGEFSQEQLTEVNEGDSSSTVPPYNPPDSNDPTAPPTSTPTPTTYQTSTGGSFTVAKVASYFTFSTGSILGQVGGLTTDGINLYVLSKFSGPTDKILRISTAGLVTPVEICNLTGASIDGGLGYKNGKFITQQGYSYFTLLEISQTCVQSQGESINAIDISGFYSAYHRIHLSFLNDNYFLSFGSPEDGYGGINMLRIDPSSQTSILSTFPDVGPIVWTHISAAVTSATNVWAVFANSNGAATEWTLRKLDLNGSQISYATLPSSIRAVYFMTIIGTNIYLFNDQYDLYLIQTNLF